MKLHLKIASIILNFSLAAYFVPSMFGSDTDDDCMFKFDDLRSKEPQPAALPATRAKFFIGDGLESDDEYASTSKTMDKSSLKLVTHKASSSHSTEDDDIFPFELTDETPPQLVVPPNATSPYDTDNEDEESDDDTPYIEEIPESPHATVAKSNAIRIKPRSQSDLTVKTTKIQQRPRSESEPIYIPIAASPKLSDIAEEVSIGLHILYNQYDYRGKKTLMEYDLFSELLEKSKNLTIYEIKVVLDSLPKDSHSTFALKTEVYAFLMANQKTAITKVEKAPHKTDDLLPKPNKLLIMP